jgi:hypothetical protein
MRRTKLLIDFFALRHLVLEQNSMDRPKDQPGSTEMPLLPSTGHLDIKEYYHLKVTEYDTSRPFETEEFKLPLAHRRVRRTG